jgi:prenylcysteine oxidase/farnesylcysteine lyase
MQAAMDEAGLKRKVVENVRPGMTPTSVGVWNGRDLVLRREHDLKSRTWKEFARDTWKYKTSPRDLQILVQEKLPKYRQLYGEFDDANPSLRDMIQRLGLSTESEQPAKDYLLEKGLSPSYLHDIVQPTVRALYNRDLNDLNGLSALLAMNPAISYRLARRSKGLNELSYRLLRLSEAHIQLNSRVTKISKSSVGKYTISNAEGKNWDDYDAVVIATRLEESGIEFDFPIPEFSSRAPSFVERHITTFTSTIDTTLSPQQFNVTSAAEIPDMIFTTQGSGSGIFSIEHSVVNAGLDGDVMVLENLYKITSTKSIPDSRIAELIGQSPDVPINTLGVVWVDRQVWPLASPSITRGPQLHGAELASDLYYTNVGEELVSSMEMSCRMGRLMARLIYGRAMRDISEASEDVP